MIRARALGRTDAAAARAHLARDPRANLMLADLVEKLADPLPLRSGRPEVVGAWSDETLSGLLSLRPHVLVDSLAPPETVSRLAPYLSQVEVGLVRSPSRTVDVLWEDLERGGRRAVVDRIELAYALDAPEQPPAAPVELRRASPRDLDDLVTAARASLREEGRPDPFRGDPSGFRRWVRSRMGRARLLERDGRVVFVAYADVQRAEGWLLQGVYTWPDCRRRGHGVRGIAGLCDEAFRAGASHVQLAVVEGNEPAVGLYEKLGFRSFARLRTILFT